MTALTTTRTTRRPRKCDSCGGLIEAGEQYARTAIPPGGELGYLEWSVWVQHASPAACYEVAMYSSVPAEGEG